MKKQIHIITTHAIICAQSLLYLLFTTHFATAQNMDQQASTKPMQSQTICFYLQEGVEVLDFAGPMEAFATAGFKVFTVSKTQQQITSQGILKILPDFGINNAPEADIMVFFGGNSMNAYNDPEVISWIQKREKQTKYFLSVCSGAFILGKAGILDGLTATTFHTRIKELRHEYPRVKVVDNVRFVDNGRVITTAGVSAGIDGALHLIAKLKGEKVARKVVEFMEYDKWSPKQGLIISPAN
jgi:transcriptional regulator GlxA family with amidase domain